MKAATPKDEVLLLAKAIGEELHLAIANYQVFAPTGRDAALIDRVSALDFTWRWTFFEGSWESATPVLVEFADALLRRHEILARRIGGDVDEVEDRLLRWPVIPRGERHPGLGLRGAGIEKPGQAWQGRQRAEHEATVQAIGMRGCHDNSPFGSCPFF